MTDSNDHLERRVSALEDRTRRLEVNALHKSLRNWWMFTIVTLATLVVVVGFLT